MSDRPRVYLAGPEVFLPDALAFAAEKQALCARYEFEGVCPLDPVLDLSELPKREQAQRIASANEALMRTCALLVANLTPFRGVSMDAGTAFEVGFMCALGRLVLGYTNVSASYEVRVEAYRAAGAGLPDADGPGIRVEDFDGAENLMIEEAIIACGGEVVRSAVPQGQEMRYLSGFEACLVRARRLLQV